MSSTNDRPPLLDGMTEEPPEENIGSAHMRDDGVLELKLWAEGPGEVIGEAMFIVEPNDPKYQGVVDHLGGIAPGGYAPVRPFPPGVF